MKECAICGRKWDVNYALDGNNVCGICFWKHDKSGKVKSFHKSRRMFVLINNQIKLAPDNVEYSHADWFKNEGWLTEGNPSAVEKYVRGFVDHRGLFFYIGFDFEINEQAEEKFFWALPKLQEELGLPDGTKVFGGIIKQDKLGEWPPRKEFGTIKDIISKSKRVTK